MTIMAANKTSACSGGRAQVSQDLAGVAGAVMRGVRLQC